MDELLYSELPQCHSFMLGDSFIGNEFQDGCLCRFARPYVIPIEELKSEERISYVPGASSSDLNSTRITLYNALINKINILRSLRTF